MNAPTLEKILSSPKLPTLPTVAVRLLELTRDPDVEMADIADVVQFDQALTSKILRTVNSSYYRLSQPCPNIKRALAYLGLRTVKSIVLGFSLVDLTRRCQGDFDLMDYWRRCVYSAAAARRLAQITGCCDPDDAFTAALMQDIGMLAMHAVIGSDYGEVIAQTRGNHVLLPHCESDALGYTHADAGAQLGRRWSLPDELVTTILRHHQRGTPFGSDKAIINVVILAYRIANLFAAEDRTHARMLVSAMSQMLFHLSPDDERIVLEQACDDARDLSDLLDVTIGDLPDITDIVASGGTEPDPGRRPAREPTAATPEALTDELTGVGNRKHFLDRLTVHFERAQGDGTRLGLILIDADRLKAINQSLGREAGDVMLREIAGRLDRGVGRSGTLCRYGGEEFAALLPGLSRAEAARMAERLRHAIEHDPIEVRSATGEVKSVQATASLGVAAMEPPVSSRISRPEALVQLADKALDAAKQAGRNCVRVFRPAA